MAEPVGFLREDTDDIRRTVEVGDANGLPIQLQGDALTGALAHARATLNATPETLTTLQIPSWARGFRLWPTGAQIRFAVGEDPGALYAPAAAGAGVAQDLLSANYGVGAIAKPDTWETRLLTPSFAARTLRLRSTTASVVVDVDFFG